MKRKIAAAIPLLFTISAFAVDMSLQAIEKRIAPIGKVNVAPAPETAGNQVKEPLIPATNATPESVSGASVYASNCRLCHDGGAAGAPKLGDTQAWKSRKEKGVATLVKHTIQGYKLMPPKGGCMGCTDAEIQAAVEYILDQSGVQQK